MPNRIIREGILRSPRINELEPLTELFYRRLMSVVDDYGRTDAHPTLLRSACYPLIIDKVSEKDVRKHLTECEKKQLLSLYEADGKPYLEMSNFKQQQRAKQSKYPANPNHAQHMHSTCIADDTHMHSKEIKKSPKTKAKDEMHSTCVADAQHMKSYAHLGGGGGGDEDGGGGGGVTDQPTHQPPPFSFFQKTFNKWDEDKLREVFDSFVAGGWMWGKKPVSDYTEAFKLRLQDRAQEQTSSDPTTAALQKLAKTMAPKQSQQRHVPFVSELKEKRRVYQDRLDKIKARGNHFADGFQYENNEDRLAAIELKKNMEEIDNQILQT